MSPSTSRAARLVAASTVALASLAPRQVRAQAGSASLVGWIRDSAGAPVGQASVEIQAVHALTRTDSTGRFALRGLDPGSTSVRIRRIGFEPQSFEFVLRASAIDSVAVTLDMTARVLDAVHTAAALDVHRRAIEGFEHRRASGSGAFVTRREIEVRNTNDLSEMIADVPWVRLVRAGARHGLRFESATRKAFDCPPQYWIDGRRVAGVDIDDFPAVDVEAMELYRGASTTPSQFAQGSTLACGTVVIWTRIPGSG